jgi:Concanavalin A-like lectin/glucanases superfamily/IPT/TIG domain
MPRQLLGTAIASNTITTTQLQTTVVNQISAGGGPRVSSLIYPGDDTAANTVGGQTVYVTGSGFAANANVYINGNAVPSISFISASNLAITTPALSAATYPVYVINPETGATAIHIPGLRVSGDPSWVTAAGSLAASQDEASAWSYTVSANSDSAVTYALAGGSSLPTGISLAANGLISGTLSSPPGTETTYNFTVVATDAENQSASRAFSVTISTGEGVLFANNVLLIHADETNNKNNHTFLDSSNNNFTITRNGNATQGSFSPFSQTGWSAYFDSSGDYLSISSNSAFALGTGDFTCEGWVYLTANAGSGGNNILDFRTSAGASAWTWFIKNTGSGNFLGAYTSFGGTGADATTQTIPLNTWRHVAVTRQGGTWRFFVDGVSATITGSGYDGNLGSSSNPLTIFADASGGGAPAGYLSNLRIIKGNALYTSNFTPSTTPLTVVANTSVLTCQSNRFRDASNNNLTITRNGDTSIQPFSPFAPTAAYSTTNVGGSAYFDGTGDYLTLPSSSNLAFGTGDFSVEMWVYFTGSPTGDQLLTNISGSETEFSFRIDASNYPKVQSWFTNYANQWYHLVACRASNTLSIFVNGTRTATATVTNNFSSTNAMQIGGQSGSEFAGYISSMRITKGSSPYDPTQSTITVPTAPPTNIANTQLLCNFTNAGIFDQTAKNVLETVGDAKVTTSQYKYGTGSIVFDGNGDGLFIPYNPNLTMRGNYTIEFWIRFTSLSGYQTIYSFGYGISGDIILQTGNGNGKIIVYTGNPSAAIASDTGSTVNTGQWYHIAVVRNGSTVTIYRDGISVGSGSDTVSHNPSTATTLMIGGGSATGFNNFYFNGYLDDLRITKGYARYTSNFTPPAAAFKDK